MIVMIMIHCSDTYNDDNGSEFYFFNSLPVYLLGKLWTLCIISVQIRNENSWKWTELMIAKDDNTYTYL